MKKTRNPVFFLLLSLSFLFLSPKIAHAELSCNLALISNGDADWISDDSNNLDIEYCVTSSNRNDLLKIAAVSAVCRLGPLGIPNVSCHPDSPIGIDPLPPARTTVPVNVGSDSQPIGIDENTGKYFTCFLLQDLDRNMGAIDISLLDESNNKLCSTTNISVTPGNYSFIEYFFQSIDRVIDMPDPGPNYTCAGGDNIINTALGCISTDIVSGQFLIDSYKRLTPLSGGVALLLILIGTTLVTTSSGDPKKLGIGKSIITSAITGLLFILGSIYLMNLIGFRILQLPGL
jgi:hypothetical protein